MKPLKILFYSLIHMFTLTYVHTLANGCGTDSIAPGVNLFLYMTGEASLISCCNEHDNCYAKCVRQEDCDAQLATCLASMCSKYRVDSFRRFACQEDTQAFNFFVEYFGNDFYVKGCEKRSVMLSIDSAPLEMRFAMAAAKAAKISISSMQFLYVCLIIHFFFNSPFNLLRNI